MVQREGHVAVVAGLTNHSCCEFETHTRLSRPLLHTPPPCAEGAESAPLTARLLDLARARAVQCSAAWRSAPQQRAAGILRVVGAIALVQPRCDPRDARVILRLLQLRADLDEKSIKTVEAMLAEQAAEIARLRAAAAAK